MISRGKKDNHLYVTVGPFNFFPFDLIRYRERIYALTFTAVSAPGEHGCARCRPVTSQGARKSAPVHTFSFASKVDLSELVTKSLIKNRLWNRSRNMYKLFHWLNNTMDIIKPP